MLTASDPPVLFIHVPKTGGSTVTSVLQQVIPDVRINTVTMHLTLSEALHADPALTHSFIFGFVRNPWARMVSWWTMIRDSSARAAAGSATDIMYFRYLPMWRAVRDAADFRDFLENVCPHFPRLARPQSGYLTAAGRDADLVGRTESLTEDLQRALDRLGLPAPAVPRINASSHGDYRAMYDARTRAAVVRLHGADVAAYGYEF